MDQAWNCPACHVSLSETDLRQLMYVCRCGKHMRPNADDWIALLPDRDTWCEHWTELTAVDPLGWRLPKPFVEVLAEAARRGLNESMRCGSCKVEGISIWLAVSDFRFVGGSLSMVAGERLARSMEQAIFSKTPYVAISASGGARMQEGVLALMQMAKVNTMVRRLADARVPFFSVLTDPTYAGTAASFALIADVNIAECGASIGFTGPRVIRQATYEELPEGFQSAEFQLRHGQVDMVVSRRNLRDVLARLLRFYR